MKIPEGGYWHCEINLVGKPTWGGLHELDKDFEYIVKNIVRPYRLNKEIFFQQ